MAMMARLRIRSRLFLLLLFSLFGLLVLGAFSSFTIKAEADRATAFIDGEFASVRALSDVRAAIGNARRYEKDLLLTMGDEQETARYAALWTGEIGKVHHAIAQSAALAAPTEAALLAQIRKGMDHYAQGFKDLLVQLQRGQLHDPWAANAAMAPLKKDIDQADQALTRLSDALATRAEERRRVLAVTAGQAPWLVIAATTLVSALATLLVLATVHSILLPIRDLQATATAWGQGDLRVGVHEGGDCEISNVKRDLSRMHQSLAALVGQVHGGVEVVNSNTTEIATANSQLAQRTESAAISLQKIGASVDALAVAVKHTANAATQAVDTSASAMQVAVRGGEQVSKVVGTMHNIDQASKKIADIIGVIDGIAFQTNILALNAAVEAARAGEQGKGFAVVASEVRSLAGRSAEAAREIKAIIALSVDVVKQGTTLVDHAGHTMREIVTSVGRVSAMIEKIRMAASEQLAGIDHINASMGSVDQATQQNAAMVEESAAATLSLARETQHLRRAVAVFKLG